ncbi:MAG: ECF transporter S component [Termitinemataceae bacterium]|nr:MAG: ECF transporter S component [Termitinemataceae bacterium]
MKQIAKFSIFLIPVGVAVNFVGAQIAMLLKLPIYLDAIGTFVVGALCGGIPGAIVGVVSNTINSITYPTYMWYGIISLIYGFLAAYLSRKGVFTSLWKTILAALLFALIGGTLNSCITWILFGFDFATDVTAIFGLMLYNNLGFPKFLAELIAAIVMDVADKVISLIAMFFVLRSMPNRFLTKLKLGEVYIKNVEDDEKAEE